MLIIDPRNALAGDMLLAAFSDLGHEGLVKEFGGMILEAAGATGKVRVEKKKDGKQVSVDIEKDIEFQEAYWKCMGLDMGIEIKAFAKKTIDRIMEAEKRIHGQVHLHELGSADTLVDVFTCGRILSEYGFNARCLPIAVGTGEIEISHGMVKNPPPASRILLEGCLRKEWAIKEELSTPTGIAIATNFQQRKEIAGEIRRTGKGYGMKEMIGHENRVEVHEIGQEDICA